MKIIAFTSARSDFGILSDLLKLLTLDNDFELNLVVSGSHLSSDFGMTAQEILPEHYNILHEIPFDGHGKDSNLDIVSGLSELLKLINQLFLTVNPDILIVLGDRIEILPVCYAAVINNIPIAHIGGGDITEGAIDEVIRHSVTKMSSIHFVSNILAEKVVSQLGEDPRMIYLVGSPSSDQIMSFKPKTSKNNFLNELKIKKRKYLFAANYHPETTDKNTLENLKIFFEALNSLNQEEYSIIFTASNSDKAGKSFNTFLIDRIENKPNMYFYKSLGKEKYYHLLHFSDLVIGNSSSGLHEAPSFKTPTIDVGNRQKGRERGNSIFWSDVNKSNIINLIDKVLGLNKEIDFSNPYAKENSSFKIYKLITEALKESKLSATKSFNVLKI